MIMVTKCSAHRCPSRMSCLRYTAPDSERQSYAMFRMTEQEERCGDFLSNKTAHPPLGREGHEQPDRLPT